jgi:penicillin-binding protein 2
MVSNGPAGTVERTMVRLALLGLIIVALFVALFSRLWFLQVLASEDYRELAKENRVRRVYTEPERGRILDRNGVVLVENRLSLAVTVDRQVIDEKREQRNLLEKLARLLVDEGDLPKKTPKKKRVRVLSEMREKAFRELKRRLRDITVSPYKPVAVAYDVDPEDVYRIKENHENFRGVAVDEVPVRVYPEAKVAAQLLGYVGEISAEELKEDFFKKARPRYREGDIIGKAGLERAYDHSLRGTPGIQKVVVDSAGEVINSDFVQKGVPGKDLRLSLDVRIQRITEQALTDGVLSARARGYEAPGGGVVVMDPNTGGVVAMASFPTYDPAILADGITNKEFASLGAKTPNDGSDDALLNRAFQSAVPPGSTYKVVTAGAAITNGLATPTELIDCNPVFPYRTTDFNNWTTADMGFMDLSRALEVSCDTYFYVLGARLEDKFGVVFGDGTERFQDYMRKAGFGHGTGIDLPGENPGRVPDEEWCEDINRATNGAICGSGWLPGYSVNMAIGQGDLLVSPLQMGVTFAAIANGGDVIEPRLGWQITRTDAETGDPIVQREYEPRVVNELGLDDVTLGEMRTGLQDVVSGGSGTATSAFAGFPLDQYPIAGKTGTAQIGSVDSGKNFAWFISYAPATAPQYVVSVYIEKAGHGGDSAAPVARQIFEGIFELDDSTDVQIGSGDQSG